MDTDVEVYKHQVYKYWSTFDSWKIWVEHQLQQRHQRQADPTTLDPNRKTGAVLLTMLIPKSVWENKQNNYLEHIYIILEHRSKKLSSNPGDISFPGGKMDPEDNSVIDTALREAEEEVGLDTENLHVIDTMDEFVSNSQMVVFPVVAWKVIDVDPKVFEKSMHKMYYPRTSESERVYIIPLVHLINPSHYLSIPILFKPGNRNVIIRYFSLDPYRGETHIWGLTASILRRFIDIVFPSNTLPEEIVK